ncbi:MAG: DNA polymerase III subunit delta [Syntrophales bacterium]
MVLQAGDAGKTLGTVIGNLREGKTAPCYLLYGEEEYLVKDALGKITDLILPADDRTLNLFYINGEDEDIDKLCGSLLTSPLIPGKKVVVVLNTRIFYSKKTLSDLVQKISDHHKSSPAKAAVYFMTFLRIAGWSLDDLRDDGWKKITDEEWQRTVEKDDGKNREKWLPGIMDFCVSHELDAERYRDNTDRLEDLLRRGLPEGHHLIMTAEAVDKRKKLFKAISEKGEILYFPRIKGETKQKSMLMDTAKDLLVQGGKKLTPGAWAAIGKKTGFSLRDSVAAIEKLIIYAGEKTTIEDMDVEDVVGKTREGTVFDLTEALVAKDREKALLTLKELFDQDVHHLMILAMVIREIRLLLQAKIFVNSGKLSLFNPAMGYSQFQGAVYPLIKELTGYSGGKGGREGLTVQHPYVIYNALRNSARFSLNDLVSYLEDLVDIDLALKSTIKNPRFLLEKFFIKVCA